MPPINQRFLLALILVSVVLAGSLYGVYVFQVSRQTEFFVEQADKALEDGRIEAAANLYRHVIENDPSNFVALGKLAECLDRLGKYVDAYILYGTAARAAGDASRHLTRQIELAILLDRWDDAERLLTRGLKESPGDAQLLLLMAQSLYRQGEVKDAIDTFDEVLAQDDPPQEAFFLKAFVLGEQDGQMDEAEKVIQKLVKVHPDKATTHVFVAQWYLKQLEERPFSGDQASQQEKALRDKISASVEEALRLDPEDRSVLQVSLQDARSRRDEAAVMKLAQRGATLYPQEPMFYEFVAESAFRQEQPDVAAEWLQKGLKRNPGSATLLWDYVGLKLDRNEIDEAEQLIQNGQKAMTAVMRHAVSGRILVARGQWKDALEEFDKIESDLTSRPQMARVIYYEQAMCFGQLRQYDRQIAALRRALDGQPLWALDGQPLWVEAREALAKALYVSGRTDEAVYEFRSVVENVANEKFSATSGLLMGRLLIAQMSRRNSENADWEQVDTFLNSLDAGGVPHEEIVRLRCAMLVSMKRLDEAETYVRTELDESPSLPASLGLALIQSERRDWDAALETIQAAAQRFGDSVEIRRAEAVCLLASEQVDDSRLGSRLRELAVPPADWSAQQRNDLAVELLPIVQSADQLDVAEEMVEYLIKQRPHTVSFRIEHLKIANRRKDAELAESILADIERIAGRTAFWHYGKAVAIWTTRPDDQPLPAAAIEDAFHHLSEAASERPSWAQIPLLHALLLDSTGDSDAAISKYDEAVDLGVRDSQVIRRLVDLLNKARRFEEADLALSRLNEQIGGQADSASVLRIASETSFQLARMDTSLQLARMENAVRLAERAAQTSEAADDYLWWARLLELQERNGEAASAISKAVELAPLSEIVRLEQVRFLIRDRRADDAAEAVTKFAAALEQSQDSGPDSRLTLAECYLAIGNRDEAAQILLPVLGSSSESVERLERIGRLLVSLQGANRDIPAVEAYLEKVLAEFDDRETRIWARRELALIAARDIRHHDFESAMALVKENLDLAPDSQEDIRARALVLAAWPNDNNRKEALAILDSLDRQGELTRVDDRFLLAQLCFKRERQWVHGSRLMREILAVPEQQTQSRMHFYAEALIDKGETQDGLLWAEKLLSTYPSAEVVRLHVRALRVNRDVDRLLKLLPPGETSVRFADTYREFLTPRDSVEILGEFAEDLFDNDRQKLASRVITRCEQISQSLSDEGAFPGSGIARVLASTGRLNEALDLLERSATAGADDEFVQYVEAILHQADLPSAALERLHEIVLAEYARRDETPALLLAKAQIHEKMQDFQAAIETYQQLIAVDEENPAALNNLSFLLALRGDAPQTAVSYAERALRLAGPVPDIIDTHAVALIRLGELTQAIELLKTITHIDRLPAAHFHLAWAYSEAGDKAAADEAMLEAGRRGLRKEGLHSLEVPIYEQLRIRNIRLAD